MRFPDGSRQPLADDRTTGRPGDGRHRYRPSRAVTIQAKYSSFGWQALGLTIVFVIAAAMLGAAHGAERLPATEYRASILPISERSGSPAGVETDWEVSHGSAV